MKISYNWLKQFLNTQWEAERTGELLTDLGLEVEGITPYISVKGGLQGVVVGHVKTCMEHPNADRLKITIVDIGHIKPVQIVCGAPNVAAGQKVPVATIGTTLYTPEGEAWTIKKGKIRGEESQGMICAEDELGLGTSHDGIMILDSELRAGTPLAEVYPVEHDQVFEIGLTPNRADAMSHMGTARDLRAGLLQQKITTEFITPSTSSFRIDNRSHKIDVDVIDKEKAPRYAGVTISGLKVAASPAWLQNRLKAIGLSPINNIVDVTNYVLHELGQPLHAFDYHQIKGGKVRVKTLASGKKFVTLDGVERELHEEDLMICDAEKPMCIAGVFGGLNSGVTENTSAIFLESAFFDPVSIRKTAKRHGLNTDASFRFERGIDPNITEYALKRAALLIQEVAGGEITSDIIDIYPQKIEDHQVFLNFEKCNQLIGKILPPDTIKSILTSLEIKIHNVTETGIGMTIPAYRNDVTREVDVIEEIMRVYGYNNIDFGSKLNASIAPVSRFEDYNLQNIVGQFLADQGFYEILNNSLTTPAYAKLDPDIKAEEHVEMLNPLGKELGVLRQHMLFSALETAAFNINRSNRDMKVFEFGKTYHQKDKERQEQKHLSLLISGRRHPESWTQADEPVQFYFLSGIVSGILDRLGLEPQHKKSVSSALFSEGLILTYNELPVVAYGVVSRPVLNHFQIEQEVLYADFYWDHILKHVSQEAVVFQTIPKYPSVRRDFALLLDEHIQFDDLLALAQKTERKLLKDVNLFDVYQGDKLPKGKKSYALSFTLQDDQKTLTDKQTEKVMQKLQRTFETEFGATLR
ncbi:phenylalanine--tRNA ligase subunit beta [Croceiramulus getboli]|nr:phenylalanine--tRNA ligase subunit beta [Flavobacteriaceae bacterium YJPT1-3]